eukprot:TRINITY_DN41_c0_g1::TRINITY_DN41_c0_g1_i1::g.14837::m.14837 TRINITY_DN41_c0_g1::TRINITY_DN41_c0_g1_i1::g.14837  ORF type:complete len:104 (+),score=-5.40,DUF4111/PF13427.1/0.27 TRINITY_DN41_c0_g1_i1:241-552(+)
MMRCVAHVLLMNIRRPLRSTIDATTWTPPFERCALASVSWSMTSAHPATAACKKILRCARTWSHVSGARMRSKLVTRAETAMAITLTIARIIAAATTSRLTTT